MKQEIISGKRLAINILELGQFPEFKIFITPPASGAHIPVLSRFNVQYLEHKATQDCLDVNGGPRSEPIAGNPVYDQLAWIGSKWTRRDHVGFNQDIDYMVMEESDECFNPCRKPEIYPKPDQLKSPYEVLEIVRLKSIHNHQLKLRENGSIRQPISYQTYSIFRYRNFFRRISFLSAFSTTLKRKDDELLRKFLTSLNHRLHQWCVALDEVLKRSKSIQRPVNFSEVEYHFNYLILLTSGILDNLALLTKLILYLNDIERNNIGFRKKEFIKMMRTKNPRLAKFVASKADFIGIVSEIRHAIIHRDLSNGYTANDEVFLEVPEFDALPLIRKDSKKWGLQTGINALRSENSVDVHTFSRNLAIEFRKFVNTVLSLQIGDLLKSWLPKGQYQDIKKRAFEIRFAYFEENGVPILPYYFCNES